jgi:hypothetical protein
MTLSVPGQHIIEECGNSVKMIKNKLAVRMLENIKNVTKTCD